MVIPKLQPAQSAENLRDRVARFFRGPERSKKNDFQQSLSLSFNVDSDCSFDVPSQDVKVFIDFISDAMPSGDVYLFGGVLRDLALLGQKGFNSDIDLVVEGDWSHLIPYILSLKAEKNKFGGYRLMVGGWPIDIWSAKETWAIKQGYVAYKGVSSLTETTVLNWDAILMNWRTRELIFRKNYFEEMSSRVLDIVLEQNPNPLGMAVRVFRHFCLKNAKKITPFAARYMANCSKLYSFEEIKNAELKSYGNAIVERAVHEFFEHIDTSTDKVIRHEFSLASAVVNKSIDWPEYKQKGRVSFGL